MRVYFEKPRTTIGWKGFVNDPGLDGSCDPQPGAAPGPQTAARINEMGLPAGTEMVEMVTPQYLADSGQLGRHRRPHDGKPGPPGTGQRAFDAHGYKNGTDGNFSRRSTHGGGRVPQTFIGVDQEGYACIVQTQGQPSRPRRFARRQRPNYDPISIAERGWG